MLRLKPNATIPRPISTPATRNQAPTRCKFDRQLSQAEATSPPAPHVTTRNPQPSALNSRMSLTQAATRMPITLIPSAVTAQFVNTTQRTTGSARSTANPSRRFDMTEDCAASGSAAARVVIPRSAISTTT